jgi:hypothetical protein
MQVKVEKYRDLYSAIRQAITSYKSCMDDEKKREKSWY